MESQNFPENKKRKSQKAEETNYTPSKSLCKNGSEISENNADCDAFKKYRPRKRREQSSKCDGCSNVNVCGCIESTEIGDTTRHYIAPANAVCMKG